LVHSHKFHRFDDDAIVVPYCVEGDSDNKWIDRTQRDLHKSIVSTYRNAHFCADLINAIGRLSYLESFQFAIGRRFKNHLRNDQLINVAALRNSLESKLESARENEERKSLILQFYIPLVLTIFAIMIGMIQLLQIPCIEGLTSNSNCQLDGKPLAFKLSEGSVDVARHLLQHWYQYLIGIPITTFIVFLIAFFPKVRRWLNHKIGHGAIGTLQRITLGIAVSENFGRIIASIWIIILMVFFIILSIIVIHGILHVQM